MWAPTGTRTAASFSADCSRLWIGLGCRHRRKWVRFPSYHASTGRIRRCRRERLRPWQRKPLPHPTGLFPGRTYLRRRRARRHDLQPCWTHVDRRVTKLIKLWEISFPRTDKRVTKLIKLGEITFSRTDKRATTLIKLREFLLYHSPSHRIANGRLSKLIELREFTLSRGPVSYTHLTLPTTPYV